MYWKSPSENLICGDVDGNISWQASALTPSRKGWVGRLPVPGTGGFEWHGFRKDLPREFNPARGFIATANHNIQPEGLRAAADVQERGHRASSASRDYYVWMAGPYGPGVAVAVGIGALIVGWLVYDQLCKSPLAAHPRALGLTLYALLVAAAFGLCQVLPPRAAYIHVGALVGTLMAANVFFVIIPSQRAMVAGLSSSGNAGAVRSLHNNYLTLPVLFIMVSNHFPFTYGSDKGWLVLAAIGAVGVAIRHVFNLEGRGLPSRPWILAVVMGGLAIIVMMAPRSTDTAARSAGTDVAWAEVAPS